MKEAGSIQTDKPALSMNKEKILVVGSGAREHAICRSISRSNKPHELFCLGSNNNPGIISTCSTFQVDDINNPDWKNVFKQIAEAGYSYCEIGPYGFLPKDFQETQNFLNDFN